MFTSAQLAGVAEIETLAQAWAMAKVIAPRSRLSLGEVLEALVPSERPPPLPSLDDATSALSSSQAADTW